MDNLQQMKWVLLKWLLRCVTALLLLASNGLAATNEVGAIELAASLPLRYPCLLQMDYVAALPLLASNGLAANEVGAIESAASLRYRCLLQIEYLQQMIWVVMNSLLRCRCATAACFKPITCK
jgi:hypothetical protein